VALRLTHKHSQFIETPQVVGHAMNSVEILPRHAWTGGIIYL